MRPEPEHAEIYLLGHGTLGRYIEFIEEAAVRGPDDDLSALTAEWRAAVARFQQLEETESGAALECEQRPLDADFAAQAAALLADPGFRRTFDILPTELGMVELDRMIVHQRSVTRNFVDGLKSRLGVAPKGATLFRICQPLDAPPPPVQVERVGEHRFIIRSDAAQLRGGKPYLVPNPQPLPQQNLEAVAALIGVGVGFGTNFMNVVRVGRRILLNNGYHRALALRALGVTHVPCVIQTATTSDEIHTVAGRRVGADSEYYFESARPPLLRDYFDPLLAKVLPIRRCVRQIEVRIEIDEHFTYG